MTKYFTRLVSISLVALGLISCEKLDYEQDFTTFGEVYFVINNVATTLEIRYNGHPIESQQGTGRIRVPEGEAKFEFLNSSSGQILLEKTVQVVAGQPERHELFQPTLDAPLTFLDKSELDDEEAAPEGYYKVKLANYTGSVTEGDKIDIVVLGYKFDWITFQETYEELEIIENVGRNIEEENFHLIPQPYGDIEMIVFSYRNSSNREDVLNKLQQPFITPNGFAPKQTFPDATKNVFVGYLNAREIDYESDIFIEKEGRLYSIEPIVYLGQ